MEIQFKGTHFEIPEALTTRITDKLTKIETLLKDKADEAFVYVELGRETEAHKNGVVWRAEFNVDVEGTRTRAESTRDTIEEACDDALRTLAQEITKQHAREGSLMKRGGSAIKDIMRGFGRD